MLLAMGVTGGLVPCPTAIIIMLLGIGANVILGALYAVIIFSAGLAMTLTAVGLAALSGRHIAERITGRSTGRADLPKRDRAWLSRVLPAVSGIVVAALGLCMTAHYIHYLRTGSSLFAWLQ
jgi:ABC-type nickel/cobalt efflux system permease component RcnA